ncbi:MULTISPECIES: ABC transporter substrate-binding protein [unclassified Pseudarthrobacter]|uniref:ABC transporter substrate-binding protein n=1 Tax=unclassified Pseudarthrobacter TaxID=2647000 RepID=UPI003077BE5E
MHRQKPPTAYASFLSGTPDLSRKQFLRGVAGVGAGVAVSSLLAACSTGGGTAAGGSVDPKITSIKDLGKVGGDLGVATYEGFEGGAAIKPWLAANGVQLQFQSINSQQEATAMLKGAGSRSIDAVELALLEGNSYVDLKIPYYVEQSWFPNGHLIRPVFADMFTQPDGSLSAIPFIWGANPCNYRADKMDAIGSWHDLLDPKLKGRITLIDDALANVATGALALGHQDPSKLTSAQLDEVGGFLRKLVDQARTVAPSYGDMLELLVSGEAYAGFCGWSALDLRAKEKGVDVRSAYPKEKVMGVVDSFAIPRGAPNKGTAAAYINEFLSPEMQRYVATDLAAGPVVANAAEVLKGEKNLTFDPDKLDELIKEKLLFIKAAPLTKEGDYVTRQDWLDLWEKVKA